MDRQKVPPHICPRVTADRALRRPPSTDDPAGDPRARLTQERVSQILAAYRVDSVAPRPDHANRVWDALRLVDQGGSLRDAARATGVPKSTVERALREAKARQECIRRHLHTRKGLTS